MKIFIADRRHIRNQWFNYRFVKQHRLVFDWFISDSLISTLNTGFCELNIVEKYVLKFFTACTHNYQSMNHTKWEISFIVVERVENSNFVLFIWKFLLTNLFDWKTWTKHIIPILLIYQRSEFIKVSKIDIELIFIKNVFLCLLNKWRMIRKRL